MTRQWITTAVLFSAPLGTSLALNGASGVLCPALGWVGLVMLVGSAIFIWRTTRK